MVSGVNRFVRNPMYVGVLVTILGWTVATLHAGVVLWAVAVWAATALFIRCYEEPTLSATFGTEYDIYRRNVRRWLPRLTPWQATGC